MKSKLLLLNLITLLFIFPFSLRADNTPPLNFKMESQGNGYTIIEKRDDGTTKEIGHLVLNDTGYHVSGNEIGTIYTSACYGGGEWWGGNNKQVKMFDVSGGGDYWGCIVYNDESFLWGSYTIFSHNWFIWAKHINDLYWGYREANVKSNFWRTEYTISTHYDTEIIEIAHLKHPFFFADKEWSVEILDKDYFTDWQLKQNFCKIYTDSKKDVFCPHSLAIMAAILKHNPDFWKKEKSFSKLNSTLKQFSAQKIPLLKVQDIKKVIETFRNDFEEYSIQSEQVELARQDLEEYLKNIPSQELPNEDLLLTQQDIDLIGISLCLPLLHDSSYSYEHRYAFSLVLDEKLSDIK